MKLKELPSEVQEGLCAFEAFRRLGFQADEIFVIYDMAEPAVGAMLKTQGKVFSLFIEKTKLSQQEFFAIWKEASNLLIKNSSEEEILEMWDSSKVKNQFMVIANGIKLKGLIIPALINVNESGNNKLLN